MSRIPSPFPLPIGWGEHVRRTGEGIFGQHSLSISLPRNLGIAERHPERESFVVERFSAAVMPFRIARKSALKRSTTNLAFEGSWSQCATKTLWRLPMNPSVQMDV